MILVTGAAGKTGKAVIRALASRGVGVRGMVHRPAQAAAVRALGAAEVVVGSFEDTQAWKEAAAGADAIYHICPNFSRSEINFARTAVAAAKANHIERFVYHSVLHPQIEAMPHHWRKMQVENLLFASGIECTVLQPTAYMQNIAGAWRGIIEEGVFRIPYPAETRLSLVDLDDVADVAALVLTSADHGGATYELVGTAPLSQRDVAAAIGSTLGKDIQIEAETPEAWEGTARAASLGEQARAELEAMFRYYADYGLIGNSNALRWLLGRAPADLTAFIERMRCSG